MRSTNRRVFGADEGPVTGTGQPATRLTRVGANFLQDGRIWKWRGVTAFTALGDWLKGDRDKLEHYADETQRYGVNLWRIFAMWVNTGLTPKGNPQYYDGALAFFAWAKARGLYVQGTAFCDQVKDSPILLTRAEQDAHLRRFVDVARDAGNVEIECSNEDWKNGDLAGHYHRADFQGVLATRSANPDDQYPDVFGPFLDFTVHHPPRKLEWARGAKELVDTARLGVGGHPDPANPFHRFMPPTGLPAVDTERTRIAEGTTPSQHADAAALAELFGAGGNIHGGFSSFDPSHATDLQNCVFTENARPFFEAIAEVWAAGITADAAASGVYTRGGLNDCPIEHTDRYTESGENRRGALRSFFMKQGNKATGVVVDPGDQYPGPIGRDGWRVVRTVRNVVFVER